MKSYLFIITFFISIALSAQDTIVYHTGEEIPVKIIEIGIKEIKYKKWSNIDGPIYVNSKAEIFAIKFENGSVEVFKEGNKNPNLQYNQSVNQLEGLSQDQKYMMGRMDAKKYYKGNAALWGTGAATFLLLPLGVIVGTATALTPPNQVNYNAPDPQLLKDNQYHLGYKRQAHSKKAGKSLAGFSLGLGSLIILAMILQEQ